MKTEETQIKYDTASQVAHEYIELLENKLRVAEEELQNSQLLNIQLGNRVAEMRNLTSFFN